jgi:hypothetical protein
LLPFAMKNLVVTIWRPGSLVILNSKLVSCKMDKAVFEVPTIKPSAESQQALTHSDVQLVAWCCVLFEGGAVHIRHARHGYRAQDHAQDCRQCRCDRERCECMVAPARFGAISEERRVAEAVGSGSQLPTWNC